MIPKPYNVIHDASVYTVVCMMHHLYSITTHWTLMNDVLYSYQPVIIIFDSWSKHTYILLEAMFNVIIWQEKICDSYNKKKYDENNNNK